MKVLVTGAEGFIGSHLTEMLIKKNFKVRALILYNSFNSYGWIDTFPKKIRDKIEVLPGDVRDKEFVERALKGVDVVFNLAALIGIPYSYIANKSYIDTNVIGLLNILNASIDTKVKQIIHISTSEVYGTPKILPIKENFMINAQSPYAASKIAADQLALSFYKSYGLPITIIRPFNTYGPRQSARAIIPTIITQALKKNIVEIGSIFPTRDFLFVEDTVRGMMSAINKKKSIGEIINLGSGYEISIKNLAYIIAKILRVKIKFKYSKVRIRPKKSEVERLLASNKKAKKILNWKPKFKNKKGLEMGIIKTINWFRNKNNLKLYKSSEFNY
tara:strand:+ start:2373 stop:3365 length:993 start_codon:yes stop_codon:yes gene_type:complete